MPAWTPGFPHRKPRKYDPRVDPFSKEKELQEWLRGSAKKLGLLAYHTHNSKHSPSGFPDVVIGNPRSSDEARWMIVAELKMPWNPNPTDSQRAWLDQFSGVKGVVTFLWTSDDLTEMRDVLSVLNFGQSFIMENKRREMRH